MTSSTADLKAVLDLMKSYRVSRLEQGDLKLEMVHVTELGPASDPELTFQALTGIDPMGTVGERRIASKLIEVAHALTQKGEDEEDRYAE